MKPDPSRWVPIGPEVGPMVLLAASVSAVLASVVLLFAGLPWALLGTILLLGTIFLARRRLRDRRWMYAATAALVVQVAIVVVMFIAQTR